MFKNAAYGQQLALSYVYDIQPKTMNRVKNRKKKMVEKSKKNYKNCKKKKSQKCAPCYRKCAA